MQRKLNDWKHDGETFMWRFLDASKGYQGWHLAIDSRGALAIKELFQIFDSLNYEGYRTVSIKEPTEKIVSIPGSKSKVEKISKIKISYIYGSPENYQLVNISGVASLEVGAVAMAKIITGLDRLIQGETDFYINPCIGEKSLADGFWFWNLNNHS